MCYAITIIMNSCLKETLIGFRAASMLKKKWHWQVQSAARQLKQLSTNTCIEQISLLASQYLYFLIYSKILIDSDH